MAIVLKYGSPGPILEAGFAGGIGQRQKEQQQSALQIWQQQQYQAFQAQQQTAHNQQQFALQQQNQNFQADQNAEQQYQQVLNRRFQTAQADQRLQQSTVQGLRKFNENMFFKLPQIPEHADPATRKLLTEKRNAIRELIGPTHDPTDPRVQGPLQDVIDSYTAGVAAIPPAKNFIHIDNQGNEFDQPVEGLTRPFDKKNRKFLDEGDRAAQAKQQAETAKQDAKMQADFAKTQKEEQAAIVKRQEQYQAAKVDRKKRVLALAQHLQTAAIPKIGKDMGKVPPLDQFIEEAKKHIPEPEPPPVQTFSGLPALQPGQPGYVQPGSQSQPQQDQVGVTTGRIHWGGTHGEQGQYRVAEVQPKKGEFGYAESNGEPIPTLEEVPDYAQYQEDQRYIANGLTPPVRDKPTIAPPIRYDHQPSGMTPGQLAIYQRDQAAKARSMGISGSQAQDPRVNGEGSKYTDPSGKVYQLVDGMWKRIQ